ncbi:MAG: hypothetical protein WCG76_11380 [Verrucomicrobiota bacterium]
MSVVSGAALAAESETPCQPVASGQAAGTAGQVTDWPGALEQKAHWPRKVHLLAEQNFDIVLDGTKKGAVKLPKGVPVDVLGVEGEQLQVGSGAATGRVHYAATDLLSLIVVPARQKPEAAAAQQDQVTATIASAAGAATDAWKAVKTLGAAVKSEIGNATGKPAQRSTAPEKPTAESKGSGSAQAGPAAPMGKGKYAAAKKFGENDNLGPISAVVVGKNDELVVASVGKVTIYDPESGECRLTFETGFPRIATIAVDGDAIYAFNELTKVEERVISGRTRNIAIPLGVACKVFSWDGKEKRSMEIKELKSIKTANIYKGDLYAADLATQKIGVFDSNSGRLKSEIKPPVRLCCGIFHFTIDPASSDLLVSNLGAFKLQRYGHNGKLKSEFGERGPADKDFQGCCNPVSSAVLPDGNLVVTEKDPSRVKIYTKDGQLLEDFENLKELVAGCNRVLVASDSRGRIYLGVNTGRQFVAQYVRK